MQVLFLQGHSTCFGHKRPLSGVFKTSTAATGTCVIVAGKSSHLLIRVPGEWRYGQGGPWGMKVWSRGWWGMKVWSRGSLGNEGMFKGVAGDWRYGQGCRCLKTFDDPWCRGCKLKISSLMCLSTNFSILFSVNCDRIRGQYALASIQLTYPFLGTTSLWTTSRLYIPGRL